VAQIEIREISVDDADALRTAYPVLRAGDTYGREGRPFWSEREFVAMMQVELPDIRRRLITAHVGDRVVGGVFVMLPLLDNLDKLYVHVVVHPDERRQGVGTALERRLSEIAQELGRPTVIGVAYVPADQRDDHPYRRFAESRGYALANVEIGRALELPVAAELLDAWEAEAEPYLEGYRLETFDGPIPEELAPSFCHLLGLLASEAPTGDLDFEPEVVPIEALRAREKAIVEQGRTVFTTLAIDSAGEAVADTVLGVSPDDTENVMQWATLVRSDHRGHRLGLAVKVRNLRAMQAAFPDRKRIWTQNSEGNDHMVSINEKLGFTPVEVVLEFQRKAVDGSPGA
jgi:GNAT superfamily N-acetyltransferase